MITKIPKRAIQEAKARLYIGGFRGGLDRVAKATLAEPVEMLESFGCKITFPKKITKTNVLPSPHNE